MRNINTRVNYYGSWCYDCRSSVSNFKIVKNKKITPWKYLWYWCQCEKCFFESRLGFCFDLWSWYNHKHYKANTKVWKRPIYYFTAFCSRQYIPINTFSTFIWIAVIAFRARRITLSTIFRWRVYEPFRALLDASVIVVNREITWATIARITLIRLKFITALARVKAKEINKQILIRTVH